MEAPLHESNLWTIEFSMSPCFGRGVWRHADSELSNIISSFKIFQNIQGGGGQIPPQLRRNTSIEVYVRIDTSSKWYKGNIVSSNQPPEY